MSDRDLWTFVVSVIGGPFLLHWLKGAFDSWRASRKAKKADLPSDEREARIEYRADLERSLARAVAERDREAEGRKQAIVEREQMREERDYEAKQRRKIENYAARLRADALRAGLPFDELRDWPTNGV